MNIQFISDSIVRVSQFGDENDLHPSLIILPQPTYDGTAANRHVQSSGRLTVEHSPQTDRLVFRDADGAILLEEPCDARSVTPSTVDDGAGFEVTQSFVLRDDEAIYGLGQFQDGHMNYRGKRVDLIQCNKEIAVPVLVSTGGWGILWDNYSHTVLDDTGEDLALWSEAGNGIDYYFIYGPSMDEIIAGYRQLTGAAPLFGKWAYGFWQSKERYKDRNELVETIREYRERKIPIDNIVQDWRYWGRHGWSAMKFDDASFPDPTEMIRQIHEEYAAHLMVSIWPCVGTGSDVFNELKEDGHLFPVQLWCNGRLYDAYSEKARDVYWKHAKKGLFDQGVDAWWMDGTEPELISAHDLHESKHSIAGNGRPSIGSWRRYLNTFSLMTTKGIYENQRSVTSDKRVFILSRSSFAGQQRYAAATWSGDISASWDVFRKQISAGLNYCMAGAPYWTTDIGAFFINGRGASYPDGCKDDSYKELYVRWYQYGAFCPLFRAHGTGTPREVWQFGEEGHWAYDVQVKFDNLRYRLMPYIYSLAWMVTDQGYTMMRGLPMDFREDHATHGIDTQFMFGPALMVCPVIHCIDHPRKNSDRPIYTSEWGRSNENPNPIAGEYYTGLNFDTFQFEESARKIDFDWSGAPPPNMPEENYSIRWTGRIVPDETGPYEIHVLCDHGVRMWIENELVIDAWDKRERGKLSTARPMEANTPYDVVLEYCHADGNTASIVVTWSGPSATEQLAAEQDTRKHRDVYLPKDVDWYDFWTGERFDGGITVQRDCPIEVMPLYVRAGSIVPMGPYLQYATEGPADPIELRIYPGKDGAFTLYEDENDTYNYEQGVCSTIQFSWIDDKRQLTIGERHGKFPDMLQERTFHVVIVRDGRGVGVEPAETPDAVVVYAGDSCAVIVGNPQR